MMRDENNPPPSDSAGNAHAKKEKEPSQADLLVQIVLARAELFRDGCEEAYVSIASDGQQETMRLRSKRAQSWLAREFHRVFGKAPGGQAKADALSVLEGIALHDRAIMGAPLRTGEHGANIYIDLANDKREVVQINAAGWRVIQHEVPVRFVRPKAMASLPRPERGGRVDELRRIVNVKHEHHFRLLIAWLLGALRPRGPYAILCVQGEAGSAKSMLARIARSLVDPNVSPLRTTPRDERDLAIASRSAHVIAYNNLSGLPLWLSDALCRVSTGGGFSTRQLCTDDEEVIFDYVRPVVVNGIDDLAVQPDLADRSLVLSLTRIGDVNRRCEEEVLAEFAFIAPRVFGALLDAVACALRRANEVRLSALPRMADFAKFVTAAEPALGWEEGAFMSAYAANRADIAVAAMDASLVAQVVSRLVAEKGEWTGQPSQLLDELNRAASDAERNAKRWPKAAHVLTGYLRRDAPVLRERGIDVQEGHEGRGASKRRVVTLRTTARGSVPASTSVPCRENVGETRVRTQPHQLAPGGHGAADGPSGDDNRPVGARAASPSGHKKSSDGGAGDVGDARSIYGEDEPFSEWLAEEGIRPSEALSDGVANSDEVSP